MPLNRSNQLDRMIQGRGHGLMHRIGFRTLDEQGYPAVTREKLSQFLMADAGEQGGVVDLVAVEIEDRQHRAIAAGIEKLVDVPGSGQGSGFRLAIPYDCRNDQVRVIEGRAAGMREHIAQFTAFVDGPGGFRRAVAANAAREGELLEESPQAIFVEALVGIDFRVTALQINRSQHPRRAMARSGQEYGIEVIFPNGPVQVSVGKGQCRAGAPVPQQSVLDVLRLERLAQQGVVLQIDHAQSEVIASAPEGMHPIKFFNPQRGALDGGAGWAKAADAGTGGYGLACGHGILLIMARKLVGAVTENVAASSDNPAFMATMDEPRTRFEYIPAS